MDMHKRSAAKTVSFRIIATITTIVLVLAFTGNLALAGVIGTLEFASKLIIYYLHERVWNMISWGKNDG